jgi:predicted ArsR family transcriptional regulator
METNEVSRHQVLVFRSLKDGTWVTSKEVAERAKVAERTARAHLKRLVDLGLLDEAKVFPGHRYRLSEKAEKRNGAYVRRLEEAASVFGDVG